MNLDHFIKKGHAEAATLETLLRMSVEIAKGLETIHTIPGGPFHHTGSIYITFYVTCVYRMCVFLDIQPRQFMVDSEGHVLINDFNRGIYRQN